MKKLLLLTLSTGLAAAAVAQSITPSPRNKAAVGNPMFENSHSFAAGKTTAVGDTFIMPLFATGDTMVIYTVGAVAPADSGFAFGTNAYGDKAWAQRYDIKGTDSTVKVIGTYHLMGGNISAGSSKTVDLKVWQQGAKTVWARPTLFNSGFPGTVYATKTVSINSLGIGVGTDPDSYKVQMFSPVPTTYLSSNFFVGYVLNTSAWASVGLDTFGLKSSQQGERTMPGYTVVSASDTTINNYNATMFADGTWHDNGQEHFHVFNKLYIRPIIIVGAALPGSVSVTNADFSFHGNYPNPAVNSTNISFGLAATADVTVQVMDMNGRILETVTEKGLRAGEHNIAIDLANYAAGDYLYLVNTSNGGGIVSKMSVIK